MSVSIFSGISNDEAHASVNSRTTTTKSKSRRCCTVDTCTPRKTRCLRHFRGWVGTVLGTVLKSLKCRHGPRAQKWLNPTRKSGAPGEIRTPDLLLRRQSLYPSELRARCFSLHPGSGTINPPCQLKSGRIDDRKEDRLDPLSLDHDFAIRSHRLKNQVARTGN